MDSHPASPRGPDSRAPPDPRPDEDVPTEIPPPAPEEDNPGREMPDEFPAPGSNDEIRRRRARQRLVSFPLGSSPD